ncbi:hypothetical protein ACFXAF_36315 [Kitasatospora sp. NPDC059463]|uniref:hypothetical protein n=1 Tax=unclassified Kitasatospora TaxID=2633591 RepID=UPI0036B6E6FD
MVRDPARLSDAVRGRVEVVVGSHTRHPRHTADGAHQWLRAAVRRVLRPAPGA